MLEMCVPHQFRTRFKTNSCLCMWTHERTITIMQLLLHKSSVLQSLNLILLVQAVILMQYVPLNWAIWSSFWSCSSVTLRPILNFRFVSLDKQNQDQTTINYTNMSHLTTSRPPLWNNEKVHRQTNPGSQLWFCGCEKPNENVKLRKNKNKHAWRYV